MQHPPGAPPYVPDAAGGGPAGAREKPKSTGTIACLSISVVFLVLVIGVGFVVASQIRKLGEATAGAEARNAIRLAADAQMEAFKSSGKLCGTSVPVPSRVPMKASHQPSSAAGQDFHQGSPTEGWPCLKFELTKPIRYQYEMRVGGSYKGVARGGPDAGPDGFEISAEGDLDGDGHTSLFVRIGRLDRATNTLVIEDRLFVADERE
jgi:hypothetical protein